MGSFPNVSDSRSVRPNSLVPHGLQHARLLCPQSSPGKNTKQWVIKVWKLLLHPSSIESTSKARDTGLIPGSGRSLGGGNGNPLQYSYMKNSIDRSLWAMVHVVTKSQTCLSNRHLLNKSNFLNCCTYTDQTSLGISTPSETLDYIFKLVKLKSDHRNSNILIYKQN